MKESKAAPAATLVMPASFAIASTNSAFVICPSFVVVDYTYLNNPSYIAGYSKPSEKSITKSPLIKDSGRFFNKGYLIPF
jgi:hypothetical protein